jgi:hypothetical protein
MGGAYHVSLNKQGAWVELTAWTNNPQIPKPFVSELKVDFVVD